MKDEPGAADHRVLFDNIPVGIISVTPDGDFLFANRALLNMLGYTSLDELAVANLDRDHAHRPSRLVFKRMLEERGEVRGFESTWRRRDGTTIQVSQNATAIRDESGQIVAYEGTVEDITERKRIQEELRDSRERYRNLVEHASDIIYRADVHGRFTFVNLTVRRVLGYAEDELLGKHFLELIVPEYRELAKSFYAVQFQTKTPNTYFEFPVIAKDGERVWIGQNVQTIATGQWILGFQAVARDISERKHMEAELAKARDVALESARVKSEFLANMSHEIRTPMNGVIGMADVLLSTRLTPEQRECAMIIRGSAESLLALVDDILDLSKIEAGKLSIKPIDFDLDELIDGITDVFAERASSKGLRFRTIIYPDVERQLHGDALRLRQVLVNLVGNAMKFTETGEISLSVMQERQLHVAPPPSAAVAGEGAGPTFGNDIVLWFLVTDTGIGISEADQTAIFTPFRQADGSTTRKYGGTGLGLAISKQLVEMMNGRIGVASVADEGSTFWFTAAFTRDVQPESRRAALGGVRALLVDSNEVNRLMLRRHLGSLSVTVEEAATADAAIAALHRAEEAHQLFDVIVLEMQLAGGDGIAVARQIRAAPRVGDTPIVLVTALGRRKSDHEFFRTEKIDTFVMKPVRRAQLASAIAQVIKRVPVPVEEVCGPALAGHDRLKPVLTQHDQRILVVEDIIVNQKVAVGQLQHLGYNADVASSGTEAIEAVRRRQYALILLDCQMPDIDGYDVARAIRQMENDTRRVPIVAMTAHAGDGEREKCLAAGMDDYLAKPVSTQRLGAALAKWLGKREPEIVDQERIAGLQQLARSNPTFLKDITGLFREDALLRLHELRDALRSGNADALARAAHALKSSSGNIGAARMYSLCTSIESNARQGSLEGASDVVNELVVELDRALDALAQSADSAGV